MSDNLSMKRGTGHAYTPPQNPTRPFFSLAGGMRGGELGFGKYAVPHPLPGGEAPHLGAINSRAGIENVYSEGPGGGERGKVRRDLVEDPRNKKGRNTCSTVAVTHGGLNLSRSANSRVKPWGSELVVKRMEHGGGSKRAARASEKRMGKHSQYPAAGRLSG